MQELPFFYFLNGILFQKLNFIKNNKKLKKAKDLYKNLNNKNKVDFDSLYQIINSINPQFISSEFHDEYKNIKKYLICSNLSELKLEKITEEEIKFFLKAHNVINVRADELLKTFKSN